MENGHGYNIEYKYDQAGAEAGLLEREITAMRIEYDSEFKKVLERALADAEKGKYEEEAILKEYRKYALSEKYAHCHFMALLMCRINCKASRKLLRKNASKDVVSCYVYAWSLIKSGCEDEGWGMLKQAADSGHIFAKKQIVFRNSGLFRKIILFPYLIYLAFMIILCIRRNNRSLVVTYY